jgi:transposase-like protein
MKVEKRTSLFAKQYQDADTARVYLEKLIWPNGAVCPHCDADELDSRLHYAIGQSLAHADRKGRKGLYKCYNCRKQFTVTVGTIFEDSKIPLHKWLLAIKLMCTSKKGISAHQLMRNLGLGSYRTAWFMAHRIRWAMTQEPIASQIAGKLEGTFEIDDVWIGGKNTPRTLQEVNERRKKPVAPLDKKIPVTTVLHREGNVRSIAGHVTGENLRPAMGEIIDQSKAHIMTDAANKMKFGRFGWKHSAVDHSKKEYGRYENGVFVSTNTVESYFAIVKRSIHGIFHHVGKKYISMYTREWDYRYNVRKMDDHERTIKAIRAIRGKRLMLKALKRNTLAQ